MTKAQQISLFLLRVGLGWLFFYAGITKVLNPNWSAAGYLNGAKAFAGFYHWLASPGVIGVTNLVNEWGLTLLGVSLILGIGVRLSSILGAVLMILYWLPLGFPMPDTHSYIVDDHIVYTFALILFANLRAGRVYGLERWFKGKFPKLSCEWFG